MKLTNRVNLFLLFALLLVAFLPPAQHPCSYPNGYTWTDHSGNICMCVDGAIVFVGQEKPGGGIQPVPVPTPVLRQPTPVRNWRATPAPILRQESSLESRVCNYQGHWYDVGDTVTGVYPKHNGAVLICTGTGQWQVRQGSPQVSQYWDTGIKYEDRPNPGGFYGCYRTYGAGWLRKWKDGRYVCEFVHYVCTNNAGERITSHVPCEKLNRNPRSY